MTAPSTASARPALVTMIVASCDPNRVVNAALEATSTPSAAMTQLMTMLILGSMGNLRCRVGKIAGRGLTAWATARGDFAHAVGPCRRRRPPYATATRPLMIRNRSRGEISCAMSDSGEANQPQPRSARVCRAEQMTLCR